MALATAADAATLQGVRGSVTLIADSLFTGLAMRDKYARRAVLETVRYPEITFTIDSLVDVQRGDTIWGIAAQRYPNEDVRVKVGEIEQLNGLGGPELQAGQSLKLPPP